MLRAFVRYMRKKLSPVTVRNKLYSLTVFFDVVKAEKWARLERNPAREPEVREELPEIPRREVHVLEAADVSALLSADDLTVPPVWRVRYALAAHGLEDGAIAGLRIDDIDRARRCMKIRQAVKIKGPKGWASPGRLKTVWRVRTVPIHPRSGP